MYSLVKYNESVDRDRSRASDSGKRRDVRDSARIFSLRGVKSKLGGCQ